MCYRCQFFCIAVPLSFYRFEKVFAIALYYIITLSIRFYDGFKYSFITHLRTSRYLFFLFWNCIICFNLKSNFVEPLKHNRKSITHIKSIVYKIYFAADRVLLHINTCIHTAIIMLSGKSSCNIHAFWHSHKLVLQNGTKLVITYHLIYCVPIHRVIQQFVSSVQRKKR